MIDPNAFEASLRLALFIVVFSSMTLAERIAPRRAARPAGGWLANLLLMVISSTVIRLVSATSLVGVAVLAQQHGIGLFTAHTLPSWCEFVLVIAALDLLLYGQHRLLHRVALLWRLHAVHHADRHFDASTGVRFHPGEAIVSFGMKSLAVVCLGAAPFTVLVFEVLLNAASLFGHSNVRISAALDRRLRLLIVTPDMHRIHHSLVAAEREHNYGFLLTWWDRAFSSYQQMPVVSHAEMKLGLTSVDEGSAQRLLTLLLLPVRLSFDKLPRDARD